MKMMNQGWYKEPVHPWQCSSSNSQKFSCCILMRKMNSLGLCWSFHSYMLLTLTDPVIQIWSCIGQWCWTVQWSQAHWPGCAVYHCRRTMGQSAEPYAGMYAVCTLFIFLYFPCNPTYYMVLSGYAFHCTA